MAVIRWKETFLVLVCGIVVGTQFNENRKLVDAYFDRIQYHDEADLKTSFLQSTAKQVADGQRQSMPPASTRYKRTNKTMSGCLLLLDDTIRLVEWLAYHYTVLPLRHLVVALDPKSKRQDEVFKIIENWSGLINITTYTNDTWLTLGPEEGWGRQIYADNGRTRGWWKNKQGDTYRSQAHKRRQNFFFAFCQRELYATQNDSWAVFSDSDEFLVFNYRHKGQEDPTTYDTVNELRTREDIDEERSKNLPIRDRLPRLDEEVTVADFLFDLESNVVAKEGPEHRPRCINVPHLQFSSHESNYSAIAKDVPEEADPSALITLRQRMTGPMNGAFSKAILNFASAHSIDWFKFESVVNVHTPNRRMCGRKGRTGSGTDYMGAFFRLNHYRAGTLETYVERSGDYRGGSLWRFYKDRNFDPVGENDDVRLWVRWFVKKVGSERSKKLLFQPLETLIRDMQTRSHIEDAKVALSKLHPTMFSENTTAVSEPSSSTQTTLGKSGAVCLYIMDDTIRLLEWMAYHYTVLPLGRLVVGIDPRSKNPQKVQQVLDRWSSYINITVFANDTWLEDINATEAWKRRVFKGDTTEVMDWYADKQSSEYKAQAHKRRQNVFVSKCLTNLKAAGSKFVSVLDSDEFLIFNYKSQDEDPERFDSLVPLVPTTKEQVLAQRKETLKIRTNLPHLDQRVTIVDFLEQRGLSRCLRLPALNFSAHQVELHRSDLPKIAQQLTTLTQQRTGPKEGRFSKVIMNLSAARGDHLDWRHVDSVHNPCRDVCPFNGRSGSGADYISSILRINHYCTGTVEGYFERTGDFRGHGTKEFLETRLFAPEGHNNDVLPWIDWFLAKVGAAAANDLLFEPLLDVYKVVQHIISVKDTKAILKQRKILP